MINTHNTYSNILYHSPFGRGPYHSVGYIYVVCPLMVGSASQRGGSTSRADNKAGNLPVHRSMRFFHLRLCPILQLCERQCEARIPHDRAGISLPLFSHLFKKY